MDNKFHGIEGGDSIDLVIISAFDVPKKFSDQLDPSVAPPPEGRNFTENGFFTNEELRRVPTPESCCADGVIDINTIPELNSTLYQEIPRMELKTNVRETTRMTEILMSWVKEKFAGFAKFFEESGDTKSAASSPMSMMAFPMAVVTSLSLFAFF